MAPRMGCVVLVALAMLVAGATAQMDCNMAIASLQPCLLYVNGPDPAPSQICCDGLKNMNGMSPACLCQLVASMDATPTVIATKVDSLPRDCGVNADESKCPASAAPPMPTTPVVSGPGAAPGPASVVSGAASLPASTAFVAAIAGAVAALAM